MTGRTLNRSEGDLHGQLQDTRVARGVVLAEERAQRLGRIRSALSANVVADDHLIVAGVNVVAGQELLITVSRPPIWNRQIRARVDAGELRVVEHIERFQTELDIPVLVRIAERDLLEDRQVGVVDPWIPEVGSLPQADAAERGEDERVRIYQKPVRSRGRVTFDDETRRLCPGAGDALADIAPGGGDSQFERIAADQRGNA